MRSRHPDGRQLGHPDERRGRRRDGVRSCCRDASRAQAVGRYLAGAESDDRSQRRDDHHYRAAAESDDHWPTSGARAVDLTVAAGHWKRLPDEVRSASGPEAAVGGQRRAATGEAPRGHASWR